MTNNHPTPQPHPDREEILGDAPSLRESPRAKAWATRRAKYGIHGHGGPYACGRPPPKSPPPFEGSDGYPDDSWLKAMARFEFDRSSAAQWLIELLPSACAQISCCSISIVRDDDSIFGPGRRVFFSTGGWSGAEGLIGVLLSHFWVKHLQTQWNRGGHFQFFVPDGLMTSTSDRKDGAPPPQTTEVQP